MLFGEFVKKWKKTCRINTSEGWRKSQDQMLRDYIDFYIAEKPLDKITYFDISEIINAMNEKGRSSMMVKHVYNLLNRIFTAARDDFELIDKSPIKPKLHRPTVVIAERAFLDIDDAEILLRHVAADRLYGRAIWIQMLCGLRVGEVQGLKWDEVDFKNNTILIRRIWDARISKFKDHTKNKTQIRVPMPTPLVTYLKSQKGKPGDWVCHDTKGNHMSRNSYMPALKRLCKSAGVKKITTHELRHTCSELWINFGASAEDIRRLLNHKSLNSTKSYIHRTEFRLQKLATEVMTHLLAA